MQPLVIAKLLVLLTLANGVPVVAKKALGARLGWPLDAGIYFFDGQPLLGPSKTIRGVLLAVLATAAAAPILGLEVGTGALVGSLAMAGDCCSSFLKRRLGLRSSSRATGLDQVPESLFPLLGCRAALALTAGDIAATVAVFFLGEILLSRLLYRWRLRDRPY